MSIGREIEDIARDLIKHQHDHPPVRDLNREVDRKLTLPDRIATDLARIIGSWTFVLAQAAYPAIATTTVCRAIVARFVAPAKVSGRSSAKRA